MAQAGPISSLFGLLFLFNKLPSSSSFLQLPLPPFLWAVSQISSLPIHTRDAEISMSSPFPKQLHWRREGYV